MLKSSFGVSLRHRAPAFLYQLILKSGNLERTFPKDITSFRKVKNLPDVSLLALLMCTQLRLQERTFNWEIFTISDDFCEIMTTGH